MKLETIESRNSHQDIGSTIMIHHKGRLFKFYYHIDSSYHFQSRAYLEVMSTTNEFTHLISINVWDFRKTDGRGLNEHIDQDGLINFVKEQVIKFTKFTKPTEVKK